MKHQLKDDINVNLNLDIPTKDVEVLVDHVADAVIKVAVVLTACRIVKSLFDI